MSKEILYDALDVSRHIINYSHDIGRPIGHLKLQKLLYLTQAAFLLRNNGQQGCFKNSIQAWAYDPVVPDVYNYFKGYGSSIISRVTEVEGVKYEPGKYRFVMKPYSNVIKDEDDVALIQKIVQEYKDMSPYALVDLTHKQDPWIDAYYSNSSSYEITNDAIYEFFK